MSVINAPNIETVPGFRDGASRGTGSGTSLRFTEQMKGFMSFGEHDHQHGFMRGRETGTDLMFQLTIEVDDINSFVADPRHRATATGWVSSHALGGKRLPVERGVFNLFVETEDPATRRMLYRLFFHDAVGHPMTLSGYKVIRDDPGVDLWPDTSTLFTRLSAGHVEDEEEATAELVASGILRIHKLDFLRQLSTFRASGPRPLSAPRALGQLTWLFATELATIYRREIRNAATATGVIAGVGALSSGIAGKVGPGPEDLSRPPVRRAERLPGGATARAKHRGAIARRIRSRRQRVSSRGARVRRGTRLLAGTSASTVALLISGETLRVWRLGTLPLGRGGGRANDSGRATPSEVIAVLREGYKVSSTRENALVNMIASFVVTFGVTRFITRTIRVRGRLGPIRDISAGGRHIHHFIPGMLLTMISGGVAVARDPERVERLLAIPFGIGTALILDESALLLELEDVYWSDEGVLSVQVVFAAAALLSAAARGLSILRRGSSSTEADWEAAARAWDSLAALLPPVTDHATPHD
jgi:hypothetical protein